MRDKKYYEKKRAQLEKSLETCQPQNKQDYINAINYATRRIVDLAMASQENVMKMYIIALVLALMLLLASCRTISCASDGLNNTIQALVLDTQDAVQVTSKQTKERGWWKF